MHSYKYSNCHPPLALAQEKMFAKKEKASPPVTVSVQYVGDAMTGSMSVRFHNNIFYELLNDWDVWKRLANEWEAWRELFKTDKTAPKPPMPDVAYYMDDGLGYKGECPYHHSIHVQLIRLGSEPMLCHKAMEMVKKGNATPRS